MERRDPTDLTDEQRELVERHVHAARGRPPSVGRRRAADAILYLPRTGRRWRMPPEDLPRRGTVHSCFRRWKRDGTLDRPHEALRGAERKRRGREPAPAAALDSRGVEATQRGAAGLRREQLRREQLRREQLRREQEGERPQAAPAGRHAGAAAGGRRTPGPGAGTGRRGGPALAPRPGRAAGGRRRSGRTAATAASRSGAG